MPLFGPACIASASRINQDRQFGAGLLLHNGDTAARNVLPAHLQLYQHSLNDAIGLTAIIIIIQYSALLGQRH
jgi:hypothetical protein